MDGLICTNTTIDRGPVAGHRFANEAGGLSGAPVFAKSTAVLAGISVSAHSTNVLRLEYVP